MTGIQDNLSIIVKNENIDANRLFLINHNLIDLYVDQSRSSRIDLI
jgi:hypothetical protein